MKLGRITVEGPDGREIRVVAAEPDKGRVVDLKKAYALELQRGGASVDGARHLAHATFRDLTQGISSGDFFLDAATRALGAADDASLPIEEVSWRAAIKPPVIRDSLTFNGHIKNFFGNVMKTTPTRAVYERPGYFKGTTSTIYGHDEVIPYPSFTEQLDYELEIGYVVGKPARNLTPENAWSHVFGITIFNDWSLRDVQKLESPIGMGAQHSKDFAYGIGPWITTIDEIPSVIGLKGQVRVNGEVWSDTKVEDFIWTPEETIAYASQLNGIQPGDLIGSGTMAFGAGVELGRFLQPGDVLELDLERVGTLRNRIAAEKEQPAWWPTPQPFPFEDAQ
ncbi:MULTISPECIES: fumarylacetoacetate hydrolase family protein [unclassified Microbacterium]|uniref:fumarylacetoacetate hydrolase family protein n=1 Tax=unclassified Microbacterium TaxID=2609290 RepID=UPI000EAAA33E|nr:MULTISPECIES: fumarylacetoacetate hydrolase family protein [unclassified Microbacterium]MBT2486524.1 fumarylacetoacetate hydrolase family protein [Microbacterium sp. ISL-108]RKN69217.1 fumarylacetoacetate hydrolase family protein [Microbacterium sp. CGR2]